MGTGQITTHIASHLKTLMNSKFLKPLFSDI